MTLHDLVLRWLRMFRIALLIVGIVFLLIAVVLGAHDWLFVHHSSSATATITQFDKCTQEDDQNPTIALAATYAPVFAFSIGEQSYTIHSGTCTNPPSYSIGEQVAVLYDRRNPNKAKINSFVQIWFAETVFAGLGLVVGVIGTVWTLYLRRRPQR